MKLIESLRQKAGAALNWPGYIEVKADEVLGLCDAAEALEHYVPNHAALAKLDALEQKP